MRSIWNGTIGFGLVNIPIKIYPAVKNSETSFHYLHKEDMGAIRNQRVCKKCGKTLDYEDLVRGYQYEKDKHVIVTTEELEKIFAESSKSIVILGFVDPQEIDPMFFDKPYYLAPDKNDEKLYALLREALRRSDKVAVAKLVFHDREHLAIIKPKAHTLILEILHFADKLRSVKELSLPPEDTKVGERELKMAKQLIESMTQQFDPDKYPDTYQQSLQELIDTKLAGAEIKTKAEPKEPTSIVDIMSKLKESIKKTEGKRKRRRAA
ncbi:MAG: Ku protein [Acidobacteriota bacterium]